MLLFATEYGDFVVVGGGDHEDSNAERLERLITDDPALTLRELEEITGMTLWVIRRVLSKRGWVKDKGGAKGATRWHRDDRKTDARIKTDKIAVDPDAIDLDAA